MSEKTRGIGVSLFGIILGGIEIILAAFIVSFSTYFTMLTADVTKASYMPAYWSGLLGATSSLVMVGGIYVLVHGVKRIVDQTFLAYISAKQKPQANVA
jgi:hypothetical protein